MDRVSHGSTQECLRAFQSLCEGMLFNRNAALSGIGTDMSRITKPPSYQTSK